MDNVPYQFSSFNYKDNIQYPISTLTGDVWFLKKMTLLTTKAKNQPQRVSLNIDLPKLRTNKCTCLVYKKYFILSSLLIAL